MAVVHLHHERRHRTHQLIEAGAGAALVDARQVLLEEGGVALVAAGAVLA